MNCNILLQSGGSLLLQAGGNLLLFDCGQAPAIPTQIGGGFSRRRYQQLLDALAKTKKLRKKIKKSEAIKDLPEISAALAPSTVSFPVINLTAQKIIAGDFHNNLRQKLQVKLIAEELALAQKEIERQLDMYAAMQEQEASIIKKKKVIRHNNAIIVSMYV